MNYRLLSKMLGIVSLLIGAMMLLSLPWAFPALGVRQTLPTSQFETAGFIGLTASFLICVALGSGLLWYGRQARGVMYRKEAMAAVGLSWVLATILGAIPFLLSGTYRSPGVRLHGEELPPQLFRFGQFAWRNQWAEPDILEAEDYRLIQALLAANARGLSEQALREMSPDADAPQRLARLSQASPLWDACLLLPGEAGPDDRSSHYRIRWIRMGLSDSLFESQSGFSTTGATVISDLEDPFVVQHCLLFWRSSTHFLGGLGIIVLFVSILGQGSVGKAMMRNEMPGPTKEGSAARMQHSAWLFAAVYIGLNIVLALILKFLGLTLFDALCHAFGTMATGGFSTYNKSLGAFDSAAIDYTVALFMFLAGSNFTLLYLMLIGKLQILQDIEWQVYAAVILIVTVLVVLFGVSAGDFPGLGESIRFGLFQVISIITTTGFGTHDFDTWNSFGRGVLFLLMFVGGCAGSTGGGLKVIRHVLFLRILGLELERAYRPTVVRPLRLAGKPVDQDLRHTILLYFSLILFIFVASWMALVTLEPDATWGGQSAGNKLIDSASGIAATLNNIGPGLGTVGATQNYAHFSPISKLMFVWLMMIGRLEIYSILVLTMPGFWRSR